MADYKTRWIEVLLVVIEAPVFCRNSDEGKKEQAEVAFQKKSGKPLNNFEMGNDAIGPGRRSVNAVRFSVLA